MECPTWANYAIGGDAEQPNLWRGCVFATAPCLGPTGSQLFDVVAGRRGTLTSMDNATDWVVESGQYALDFDGINDRVAFGTFPGGLRDATVSLWVKPRGTTGRLIDQRYDQGFYIGLTSATAIAGGFRAGGTPFGATNTVVSGVWQHVALRRVGSNNRLFVNGSDSGSSSYTDDAQQTLSNTLYLSLDHLGGSFANCQIDDVRIYNRAISTAEIAELAKYRGVAYQARTNRKYFYSNQIDTITGTAAITLSNFTASASGTSGSGLSGGFRLSQATSFPLSDSLSIG